VSDATRSAAAPEVSVVIPARNEGRSIARCLDSVLAQTFRDIEVVVVDGDSDDDTRDVVAAYAARDPRVRLVGNPRRTIPAALNVGLASARGRWLVRVDAHSVVGPDYVATSVELLRAGSWGGVGGRKEAVATTPTGHAVAAALGSPFGVGDSRYHYVTEPTETDHVPFGAYPVALCRALGGWDEAIAANEDYEFDYRLRAAGHRLLLDPRLRIEWQARETVGALLRQYWRYGLGKAAVARKHPRSLRARHLAAPALVAAFGTAAVVAPRRPAVAAAICAPYAVALGAASIVTAAGVDRRARPYVPAAFAAMHLAWGAGFWTGLARGGRRR
jgi:cellulose synthase/poly-beta-1,6-N-acetylglucosamine synthase-like glycosyltransferase